ncbi:DNA cytosine methyltransferase [Agathobaculum butyriciproducens]|uniref:DNA cytosine methyltransferase n=1 Tax=Agathobaculum butyriciproducens TaxID=1628085 RepID=UPI0036D415EF
MTVLKLGSLFDGIGVFPLAAMHCGMEPVWASEIEARPISITKRHYPDMLHLGDITKISGAEIPPVDVITFGSPCQDLSQIGTRNGFAGKKSSLFYQAMRIIEEMRYATNGRYPAFTVWENVAGAFSSNDRLDFAAMLSAFTGAEVSVPPRGWAHAGMVRGGCADTAWRLLDAQYWGEPALVQRRKRVFVVADFAGQRAGKVLFKPRTVLPFSTISGPGGLSATQRGGVSVAQTGRQVPIVRPFSLRRMRTMAQVGDQKGFCASFGRGGEPFPTLLASVTAPFSFWYEGEERDGFLRVLTPLECERLMGLPENWDKVRLQE